MHARFRGRVDLCPFVAGGDMVPLDAAGVLGLIRSFHSFGYGVVHGD